MHKLVILIDCIRSGRYFFKLVFPHFLINLHINKTKLSRDHFYCFLKYEFIWIGLYLSGVLICILKYIFLSIISRIFCYLCFCSLLSRLLIFNGLFFALFFDEFLNHCCPINLLSLLNWLSFFVEFVATFNRFIVKNFPLIKIHP